MCLVFWKKSFGKFENENLRVKICNEVDGCWVIIIKLVFDFDVVCDLILNRLNYFVNC